MALMGARTKSWISAVFFRVISCLKYTNSLSIHKLKIEHSNCRYVSDALLTYWKSVRSTEKQRWSVRVKAW